MVTVAPTRVDPPQLCTPSPRRPLAQRRLSAVAQPGGAVNHDADAASQRSVDDARIRLYLNRLASCRKAIVSGIGGVAAVVISMKDPLVPLLPAGATHWFGIGVAALTALATYLATNSKPAPAAVEPASPHDAIAPTIHQASSSDSTHKPQMNTAVAGLALVAGGALWASLRRGRAKRPPIRLALLVRPSDLHTWLSSAGDPD